MTYTIKKQDAYWLLYRVADDGKLFYVARYPQRYAALNAAWLLAGWRGKVI